VTAVLGARLALDGLSARRVFVAVGLGLVTVELTSLIERSREPAYAADRALLGPTLGVVVPLVCYALFEAVYRRERTSALVDPLGRHGADRRLLSLGSNGALTLASSVAAACFTAIAAVSARGFRDSALVSDFTASLWGGALTGAAYAGLFAAASLFGRRGRIAALVLDWLFGSGAGMFALLWPRAHARNLFGGEPILEGSQAFAALVLALLAVSGVGVAAARETR
jgi:hypothetical protein